MERIFEHVLMDKYLYTLIANCGGNSPCGSHDQVYPTLSSGSGD